MIDFKFEKMVDNWKLSIEYEDSPIISYRSGSGPKSNIIQRHILTQDDLCHFRSMMLDSKILYDYLNNHYGILATLELMGL